MKKLVIYIHGKGGCAAEADHYKPLFPEFDVVGFDYKSETPWDAKDEFRSYFATAKKGYDEVRVVANSIGAFFTMTAWGELEQDYSCIFKAYFISPIVDMEKLICDMMMWAGVTENELRDKKTIPTEFGEILSWDYLCYVRANPIQWTTPTYILYGSKDHLTSLDTIQSFARGIGAPVTIMEGGEHWFHTKEQMEFLDQWIKSATI